MLSGATEATQEVDHAHEQGSSSEADTRGKPPSITVRSHGAAAEGDDDSIFDDPLQPTEICPGLLRNDSPGTSSEGEAREVLEHARHDPETIRSFVRDKAVELAKGVCDHYQPLVTWQDDPATTTCGQYQSAVIARVSLKVFARRRVEGAHLARVTAAAAFEGSCSVGVFIFGCVRECWGSTGKGVVLSRPCVAASGRNKTKERGKKAVLMCARYPTFETNNSE